MRVAPIVVAILLFGGSCGSGDSDPSTPAAGPTLQQVLADSSQAMSEVESVRFTIEQSGADLFLDPDDVVRFDGATGRFAAPSSADALVSVTALGLAAEVGAVAIDDRTWVTNPLTGAWESAPDAFSFDPVVLFDPEIGLGAVLRDGLDDAVLVSDEIDTAGRHHIRASLDSDRTSTLTGGLVEEASTFDVWIEDRTGHVVEATFDVDTAAGLTSWRLILADYGADISIVEPELGPSG